MPTIKEILQEERTQESTCLVLFLEGKFWKAYEHSAYVLTKLYNFKPTKRFIKLVGEEIISVGFPKEQLPKYLDNAVIEEDGKICRAILQCPHDEQAFDEWKAGTRVKEPSPKVTAELYVPEEWKPKSQVFREENLPVFKLAYDLLLRVVHEAHKMDKDFRYSIGQDLKTNLLRVEICIYHANDEKEPCRKVDYIKEALERMLEVKLYVRILHDSKQLSLKKYALLAEQMVEIEKHLNDWKQYYQSSNNHQKNIKNESYQTSLF